LELLLLTGAGGNIAKLYDSLLLHSPLNFLKHKGEVDRKSLLCKIIIENGFIKRAL